MLSVLSLLQEKFLLFRKYQEFQAVYPDTEVTGARAAREYPEDRKPRLSSAPPYRSHH